MALNISSEADPWSYFWSVSNDTDSERYTAWLNAVSNYTELTEPTRPAHQMHPNADTFRRLDKALSWLTLYYPPVVIFLGIIGNLVTCLIFLRSRLRTLSSSHYLAAIVIVNTVYLLTSLIHWLRLFGIDMYNRPGWCQFVNFITNTSTFLSVWYLTAFAVDRYICICWPAEAPKMCTRMRARIVIICLLCMGIVVYMNMSLTVGVVVHVPSNSFRCSPLPIFGDKLFILNMMNQAVNLLLPYLTILILLVLIVYNTCKVWKQRLLSDDPAQIRNVTIVFLCICLVLHLPLEMLRSVEAVRTMLKMRPVASLRYAQKIIQYFFYTSLAMHFIVFVSCYRMFAHVCKAPFLWLREKLLMKFRKAPTGDIHLRNVRFHAVQDTNNAAHV